MVLEIHFRAGNVPASVNFGLLKCGVGICGVNWIFMGVTSPRGFMRDSGRTVLDF